MKKYFALVILLCLTSTLFAQKTVTREVWFGVSDASVTSYGSITLADTAGATVDSTHLAPNKKFTMVRVNVVDSGAVKLNTKGLYKGDQVTLDVVNPTITGNFIYLYGNWIVSTGTKKISLTSAKSSLLKFEFDGANLVEISRNLNYTR